MILPLINCILTDAVVGAMHNAQQSLLQFFDVYHLQQILLLTV